MTTSAAKKSAPAKAATGLMKPMHPSKELAAIVGHHAMPRTEIVAKIWAYIKKQGLQDATDKRTIVPDEKLKAVLGKDKVTMFELSGLITPHIRA